LVLPQIKAEGADLNKTLNRSFRLNRVAKKGLMLFGLATDQGRKGGFKQNA